MIPARLAFAALVLHAQGWAALVKDHSAEVRDDHAKMASTGDHHARAKFSKLPHVAESHVNDELSEQAFQEVGGDPVNTASAESHRRISKFVKHERVDKSHEKQEPEEEDAVHKDALHNSPVVQNSTPRTNAGGGGIFQRRKNGHHHEAITRGPGAVDDQSALHSSYAAAEETYDMNFDCNRQVACPTNMKHKAVFDIPYTTEEEIATACCTPQLCSDASVCRDRIKLIKDETLASTSIPRGHTSEQVAELCCQAIPATHTCESVKTIIDSVCQGMRANAGTYDPVQASEQLGSAISKMSIRAKCCIGWKCSDVGASACLAGRVTKVGAQDTVITAALRATMSNVCCT